MASDEYTIIVSGQEFIVTRDQLESEPGNYFATYFLGDFQEASEGIKELRIQKEHFLFKFIHAHLRGYKIFPIPEKWIPNYMTRETTLENLRRDAEYFGMIRLEALVKEEIDALKEKEKFTKTGQRVYHFWWHNYVDTISAERAAVAGFPRTFVPLSSEGLQTLQRDHERVITSCAACSRISEGWNWFVILGGMVAQQPRRERIMW